MLKVRPGICFRDASLVPALLRVLLSQARNRKLWEICKKERWTMKETKRLSLVLLMAGLFAVAGCDQKTNEANSDVGKDKLAEAFDGKLKDCAAAAQALGVWIDHPYEEAQSVLTPSGPVATIRVIRPGTMVTRDYRIDRLNVDLDEKDTVRKIYCG